MTSPLTFVTAIAMCVVAASPASADVLIAVAGPLAGHFAERTARIADGARDAIAQINSEGGLAGQQLTLVTADDGCDREKAASVARDLVSRKVALVLGHPCESTANAAAVVYGPSPTIFIATASRHPALTTKRAGPAIFRLSGRDDTQGAAIADILAREFQGKSIALIQDRTQYARTLFDQAVATLKSKGVSQPITARIVAGDKDYKATVAKTKDADVVFFAGYPIEAGFVHAALRAAGSKARFIGSDSLATDEFATTFGAGATGVQVLASNGAMETSGGVPSVTDKADARLAIGIFAEAVKQAGVIEGAKIAAVLASRTFATTDGPVQFDAAGDANRSAFDLLEWDGKAWIVAGTAR